MILTIDLNPSTDRKYIFDDISLNGENRAKSLVHLPGGNGVTIARLLNIFNEDTFITGFLGGTNGEYYHRKLADGGIMHDFVQIKDETRTTVKLIDNKGNLTTISENGPRITREELVGFYELYSRIISKSNIICATGSLPFGVSNDIFFNLIVMANKKEKLFILDVSGEELSNAIDASPYMVIINKEELENLLNLNLNFENEIIKAGRYILDKGVKLVVINLQEKGMIVLEDEKGYRLEIRNLDIEMNKRDNSGIVAGIILGINRNYDFEMTLRLGQAFGIAYSKELDISSIEMSDVKKLMGEVEIYEINY